MRFQSKTVPMIAMHLIARDKHQSIVDLIKADVLEGWGK